MAYKDYKPVKKTGVTAVVVNGRKALLLKRISLPFITHPGIWYFVGGARKGAETPLQNAYREIKEELDIDESKLNLLSSSDITVVDHRKKQMWKNELFVFRSTTRRIRMNFEHTDYRWVGLEEIKGCRETMACFGGSGRLLKQISSALSAKAESAMRARRSGS